MLPMSSAGKANATNGRHDANETAAKGKTTIPTIPTTTTTTITTKTRADLNIKSSKKTIITTSNAATKSNVTTTTTTTSTLTSTTAKSTLPEKTIVTNTNNSMTAIKSINNDNSNVFGNNSSNKITTTTTTTTKNHDEKPTQQQQQKERISCSSSSTSSSNSCTTNLTLQQQQQHNLLGAHRRDERKYQYSRPQTLPPTLANNNSINSTTSAAAPPPPPPSTTTLTPTSTSTSTSVSSDECDSMNLDTMLVYYDGQLISGKLESLIEHMVPTSDYYPTHNYLFAFLLSARLFVRPYELLAQISKTWERQQQQQQQQQQQKTLNASIDVVDEAAANYKMIDENQRLNIQKSAQHCIRLLSEWIETFPYDFRDERLMQQVRILARKCIYIDTSLGKQVSQILQLLVQRLTALEKYEEYLQQQQNYQQNAKTNLPETTTTTTTNTQTHTQTTTTTTNNTLLNNTTTTTTSGVATATIGHLHKTYRDKQQQQQHKNTFNIQNEHKLHNNYNNTNNSNCHEQPQLQSHYAHNNYQQQQQQQQQQQHGTLTTTTTTLPIQTNITNDVPNLVLGIMDICASCAQLAHQLTAIELECLSHIGPEEFVQAFAKEYQHTKKAQQSATTTNMGSNSCSFNDMKKTRNLESYVEWFNRLSYLTATEIVKYPKKKQRVRVIEYWIETARECFNIGNFNSLMAIIAGLNLAPISRLKKTWSKVQSAKFSVLEHQMDPTSNFNSYRSTLKAAMWRFEGATDEREKIIIPFFSLFVKDLYFLNEGCSNRLPNNHINFEKCTHLAKQVMEFNEWKQIACPFEKLPNVIAFLQNSAVLNENTLSMASFECEPPENTEEKGRYKTVKAETKQQLLQQLQEQQNQH